MQQLIHDLVIAIVLFPLLGAIIAGVFGSKVGRRGAHWITIMGVGISCALSLYIFILMVIQGQPIYSESLYTWVSSGSFQFDVSVLIDRLSATMMLTVTSVSLLVHIYSIGYMQDDPGYQRFFAYMSLFTFFMLMLVMGSNFAVMFFGWEGVGLVSYLLIGFWFKKDSAAAGGLKAFVVNRVGDLGFLIGIAGILAYFGTLEYAEIFARKNEILDSTLSLIPGQEWSVATFICLMLFIGAMGKSAQIPLHIWLPESMEGPTPISALIHAATMVTAGVYMVARMSPLFEMSEVALSTVMIFGATGALFLGILAVVQHDIKRVIAYSTMSQLGYMMAANGASAFAGAMFHLVTHAYFKALLFLGAGAVIIAMHHEQDMRKMGGLRKMLPITYATFLIGTLALVAIPPFAGFYSKDAIIEAVAVSNIPGSTYAYWCLLIGAFFTALYSFRALFMTFHGKQRFSEETRSHVHEPRWVVLVPLIILAIPSAMIGYVLVEPMLYASDSLLGSSIFVAEKYNVLGEVSHHFNGAFKAMFTSVLHLPFWVTIAGVACAWVMYVRLPDIPSRLASNFPGIYRVLMDKYGFDRFNDLVFQRGGKRMSDIFYHVTDMKLLDHYIVNGSGRSISKLAAALRHLQTGYLYHYAFAMILGVLAFLAWFILK